MATDDRSGHNDQLLHADIGAAGGPFLRPLLTRAGITGTPSADGQVMRAARRIRATSAEGCSTVSTHLLRGVDEVEPRSKAAAASEPAAACGAAVNGNGRARATCRGGTYPGVSVMHMARAAPLDARPCAVACLAAPRTPRSPSRSRRNLLARAPRSLRRSAPCRSSAGRRAPVP